MNIRMKRIRPSFLLIFLLASANILQAEGTLFSAWEPELRLIPAIQISKVEDFDLKPQFSGRVEFISNFFLTRHNDIEYRLSLTGGYHFLGKSSLDGGYSYNGFSAGYIGMLIGAGGPLYRDIPDRPLSWRTNLGITGELAQYANTYNQFFFPSLRLEGGIDYHLLSFHGGSRQLFLNAGIPLEWHFRRETEINFSAGIYLSASILMGGE
ncbi:MAG: hypothetical protein JEY99_10405 [Spirochaetales bacterium]|nr:hypothetical protein [Spirochaetales bacterium]